MKVDWDDCLDVAYVSDTGMRRSNNQDSYTINLASDMASWRKKGHLFIVADGMGAHAAGELASKLAAEKIPHLYRKYTDFSAPEAVKRAVIDANAEINRRGQANEEFHNMGTTCSVLTLLPQGAVAAHVGDSRIYRLRGKRFEQLTFDHSLVWEMREANRKAGKKEEVSELIPKNVITRSLGPFPDVNVDLEGPFPIEVGDTFLLCSDGLTNQVSDEEMGAILSNLLPADASKVLVDLANLRGGPDNITLIIVRVKSPEMSTATANESPLVIGNRQGFTQVPVLAWVFFGATLLAMLIALVMTQFFPAIVLGILTASLLGFICFKAFSGNTAQEVSGGKRFGKGPYTRVDSSAGTELVSSMQNVLHDLRKAAIEEDWKVELSTFDKNVNEALAYRDSGKLDAAIRSFARGMSNLMDQLRANAG
jgi:protein phosphatase